MKKSLGRTVASSMLAVASLGFVASVAAPMAAASAATTAAKAYSGTVKTADVAKDTFTIKSGTKTYKVDFTSMTKWTVGTSKSIKVGLAVTVTGTLSGTTIKAASIKA